ncbi:hypothetical protein FPY71_08610 [Aureimonas fodinaquatilis]|uniref:DUF3971 domain-containing protein n=1 Tax=Aureimonas fodinaquatilis TaxID=2565783 RepID=A0A5B0DVV1_9HYPH|nr:hypothetical protein [Aureimonas fodinaquatilis]KAA0970553.1 hypothetical protein FPY71_08610 [Aureimonas fodinaquatilis]
MMRLARVTGALLSVVLLVAMLATAAGYILLGTEFGQSFVRNRAETALASFVGPAYQIELGSQSYALRPDGTLAVQWSNVALAPKDAPGTRTEIEHFAVAVRLLPLISGGLQFGQFEISGARLDLNSLLPDKPSTQTDNSKNISALEGDVKAASEVVTELPTATFLARTIQGTIENIERHLAVLQSFRFSRVVFSDISITGIPGLANQQSGLHVASAELLRNDEGFLQLDTQIDFGVLPIRLTGNAEFSDIDGRLTRLALNSGKLNLVEIAPPAPETDREDERAFGSDATLEVELAAARDTDDPVLTSDLRLKIGAGAVQLGLNHTRVEEGEIHLRYRSNEEKIVFLPSPFRFRDVSFVADGVLQAAAVGGALSFDRLDFDLHAKNIRSKVGSSAEQQAEVELNGMFDPVEKKLELRRGEVRTDGGTLSAGGSMAYATPDALTHFEFTTDRLTAQALRAFWPFNVAGKARRWVLGHLGNDGVATSGRIAIHARHDRLGSAFGKMGNPTDQELQIDLSVANADLITVGDLPRLYHVNGTLTTRGSETAIRVSDAMVQDMDAVVLADSSVVLSKPVLGNRRDQLIDLDLNLAGSVPQLLQIANARPIQALRSLDILPEKASGTATVQASINLRVGSEIPAADQLLGWQVKANLTDAAPGSPIEGRTFSQVNGTLDIVPERLTGNLKTRMDGSPAQLGLRIPIQKDVAEARNITVDLLVEAGQAGNVVPGLEAIVTGPFNVKTQMSDKPTRVSVDLTGATVNIPAIAWRKGKGIAATLELETVSADNTTRLENMRLTGAGFSASGKAVLDGNGLQSAELTGLSLNPDDDVSLTARRSDSGYSLVITGKSFDARPILQDIKAGIGQKGGSDRKSLSLNIEANIDRVGGFNGQRLSNFAMNYQSRRGALTALSISGVADKGQIAGDLSRRDGVDVISLSSGNAGSLLGFSGFYSHMRGGGALIELSGTNDQGYVGKITMRDFTLVDEPRLERIVGTTPVEGQASLAHAIGKDLRTSQAFFDQAYAEIVFSSGTLRVANGIVRGPVFGSSFDGILYDSQGQISISGSFMPAYGLNRVFGALPLVGQVLGNGNEGGLLGITYRLSGAFTKPTLTVNPISLIAPGIFRQIFAY